MIFKVAIDEVATPFLETAFSAEPQNKSYSINRSQTSTINNNRLIRYQGAEQEDVEIDFKFMRRRDNVVSVKETFDNIKALANNGVVYYCTIASDDNSIINTEGWFEITITSTQERYSWGENNFKLRLIRI